MSRIRVTGLLVTALLAASPLAQAAGFDCSRAKAGVEQLICNNDQLSQLDEQLTQSFAQARARAGQHLDALLRDQRNWLTERDAAVLKSPGLDGLGSHVYQDRILFLDHLFRDPKITSPLLAAIGAHMAAEPSATKGTGLFVTWWPYLGGSGKVFNMGTEVELDHAKSLPFDSNDVLKLSNVFNSVQTDTPNIILLDTAHFGGAYAHEGSDQDSVWQLFSWHDHALQAIDLPNVFNPTTSGDDGKLATYQGKVYAVLIDDLGLATSNITAQPYLGDHWGDPLRLQLRYDTYLLPPVSFCNEKDCTGLLALGNQIINRYNQTHDSDALNANLPADLQAKFATMRLQAEKQANHLLYKLPNFNNKPNYVEGDTSFLVFDESTFVPVQWHGEVLLARIGTRAYGLYSTEDLLLAIWRWDGRTFTPVLGMFRPKRRGDFVLDAWLPPDLHTPH